MRIVIISDTHGDSSSIREVLLKEQNADIYLHAGDVCLYPSEINPFAAVRGNCDFIHKEYPASRIIETPLGKLMIRHHPFLHRSDFKELKEKGIKFFVHGHTHEKEEFECDGVISLCPGSTTFPRDDEPSYLVLEIDQKGYKVIFKKL